MLKPKAPQKTRTQIIEELRDFMRRHEGSTADWYVGTAVEGRKALFEDHGFRQSDVGIFRNAASASDAASIADFLIGRGARGERGLKPDACVVYAFKLTKHTKPAKA
jgi:hypothetical protein